jgi:hypothetical protein
VIMKQSSSAGQNDVGSATDSPSRRVHGGPRGERVSPRLTMGIGDSACICKNVCRQILGGQLNLRVALGILVPLVAAPSSGPR